MSDKKKSIEPVTRTPEQTARVKELQNKLEKELVALFDKHQRRFGVVQLLYNTCLHVGEALAKA